jgi:hypothetical protein
MSGPIQIRRFESIEVGYVGVNEKLPLLGTASGVVGGEDSATLPVAEKTQCRIKTDQFPRVAGAM